jgi:hypothetical protein
MANFTCRYKGPINLKVKKRDFFLFKFFSLVLVVLVDFKALYPRVPPGILGSFPGVAHFLSFEQICQYPRVKPIIPGVP